MGVQWYHCNRIKQGSILNIVLAQNSEKQQKTRIYFTKGGQMTENAKNFLRGRSVMTEKTRINSPKK